MSTSVSTAKPAKPLTVRCRYHDDAEYTFKNLQRVKNADLFQITMLPQSEMLKLFEEVERQIKIQKEFCLKVGARQIERAWMPIPIAALTVDEEWCRNKRCDYSHVAEMVAFPVEKAEGAPIITFRKTIDALGNVTVYARIADAVHRSVAALERNEKMLMCLATTVESVAEEALIYSTCNHLRREHSNIDDIKARFASKDPKVLAFFQVAENRGLKIATSSQGRAAYPVIKAVSGVECIYDKYGPEVLDRVFQLISDTTPSWKTVEALQTDMLQGLALFVATFEIPGFANTSAVAAAFQDFTPQIVANSEPTVMAVESAFHVKVAAPNSQYFRLQAIATTVLEHYTNKIKRLNRDKAPGAAQLKALLNLWHEQKLSQYKHDQIVKLRDKLEDVEGADYSHEWVTPDVDSGAFPSHIIKTTKTTAGITR